MGITNPVSSLLAAATKICSRFVQYAGYATNFLPSVCLIRLCHCSTCKLLGNPVGPTSPLPVLHCIHISTNEFCTIWHTLNSNWSCLAWPEKTSRNTICVLCAHHMPHAACHMRWCIKKLVAIRVLCSVFSVRAGLKKSERITMVSPACHPEAATGSLTLS